MTEADLLEWYDSLGVPPEVAVEELEKYSESVGRARQTIRRAEERLRSTGGRVTEENLHEWYDSLGVPPEVAVEGLEDPPAVPEDFYARIAARHENERPTTEYEEKTEGLPEVPAGVPPTQALYYLDPYTVAFDAHVAFADGPFVA